MSIRAIAIELYRAQQKVARLEKELEQAAPEEAAPLKEELRTARLELRQMRTMLDGAKVESPFTTRSFGR
jgi:predicted  nucleic acid-binding Zn-ribbon protein